MIKTESKHFFSEQQENEKSEIEHKKELLELQDRLGSIIRTISGKPQMKVTTEVDSQTLFQMAQEGRDANKEWYDQKQYDPKTRKQIGEIVHIPDQILESNEDVAKGRAAHEAGHVAISRFGEFVPDEVLQELGFHGVLSSVEERPTDQIVRECYAGAGEWVDEARKDSLSEAQFLEKEKENLGYIPKFAQLCDLMVYAPHIEKIPDHYDPEVVELYNKIGDQVERIEKTLPKDILKENEVLEAAKKRYKIVYSKIWPEAKKLVEDDRDLEKLRQMIQDALKTSQNQLEQLPQNLKQELETAIREAMKKAEELEKKGGISKNIIAIPMNILSPELRVALEEIFDKLSKEKQQQLLEEAEKTLKKVEDEVVKETSGKLMDMPEETHEEYDTRKEEEEKSKVKEIEKQSEQKRIKKELQEIERRQAALLENRSKYDKAYEQIREYEEDLYKRLEEIFTPNIKHEVKLRSSGSRINLPAVFRWEASRGAGAKTIDNRIFESVHLPEKRDYVFTLLNDLSGSMNGEKINQDFKAKVLLTEILNRLGIKNEILGFQDEIINFKKFDEELTDEIRQKMSGMIDEVSGQNPGGHNKASWNDDGPCLLDASEGLELQPGKEKFLIVLSDGLPAGRHSTAEDLTKAVTKIMKTTNQKLIGIGLGPDTEHVKRYYPISLPNIKVDQLTEALGSLLEDIIMNPQNYSL